MDDHLQWRYQDADKSCLTFTLNNQGDIILSRETTGKDSYFDSQKSWGFKTEGKFINEANSVFYKLNVDANQIHNLAVLKSFQGDFASSYYFNKGVMHFGDNNPLINPKNYSLYWKHISSDAASVKPNSIFNENNLINDYGITIAQEGLSVEGLTYRIYGYVDVASLDLKKASVDVRGKLVVRDQLQGQDKHYPWSRPVIALPKEDLFQSRLPNEVISYMTSWLPFKDFVHFGRGSQHLHQIFQSTLTSTNFLTSEAAYAKAFMRLLFGQVQFDPVPKAIKVSRSVEADEIHFHDPDHLKRIVDETPKVETKKELYFVLDKDAKDGEEFVSSQGNLKRYYFINVVSDVPLRVSGITKLPCHINFPKKSDSNRLDLKIEIKEKGADVHIGELKAHQQGHDLARMLDQFDEVLFDKRNEEAARLFKDHKQAPLQIPHLFPDLIKLCPNFLLNSFSEISVLQEDYIDGDGPIVYKANSVSALENLYNELPAFFSHINYIDCKCKKPDIYSQSSMCVTPGFRIFSETDLLISGIIHLPDHYLSIKSLRSIWIIGASIDVEYGISGIAGKDMLLSYLHRPLHLNVKPKRMPNGLWYDLLKYYGARIVGNTIIFPN